MSGRVDRLQQLQQTVDDYVSKEQDRINNEVSVLQAILNGRTGGQGIQSVSTAAVAAVANSDLAQYLAGD